MEKKQRNKKTYTEKQLEKEFGGIEGSRAGWEMSYVERDCFEGPTRTFKILYKKRGSYPNWEREPKFKGILKDHVQTFEKIGVNIWKKTNNVEGLDKIKN